MTFPTARHLAAAFVTHAIAAGLLALAPAVTAAPPAASTAPGAPAPQPDELAAFEARFKAANPKTRIDSVSHSPIPGLYEVVMGKTLAYVEPNGRYALFGHVFDMHTLTDLTANRRTQLEGVANARQVELDRIDPAQLPTGAAIKQVLGTGGTGARVLHVFADPMCGHCRTMENTLKSMKDLTVYVYPVAVLGSASKELVRAVRCAADPAGAWAGWMLRGVRPPTPSDACKADDAVAAAAQQLGINATPTLIAADGRKLAGAMPADQLDRWLAASAGPVAKADPAARGSRP